MKQENRRRNKGSSTDRIASQVDALLGDNNDNEEDLYDDYYDERRSSVSYEEPVKRPNRGGRFVIDKENNQILGYSIHVLLLPFLVILTFAFIFVMTNEYIVDFIAASAGQVRYQLSFYTLFAFTLCFIWGYFLFNIRKYMSFRLVVGDRSISYGTPRNLTSFLVENIREVDVKQTFLGGIFNYGELHIHMNTKRNIVISPLSNVSHIKGIIVRKNSKFARR